MKVLEYYFKIEFQWLNGWSSEKGLLFPVINPSNEFVRMNGYVEYRILGDVFLYNKEVKTIEGARAKTKEIKKVLSGERELLIISSESSDLEIRKELSRPIDNLGDSKGEEAPLSWNVSTPYQYQTIPTNEIFNLFNDWVIFLDKCSSFKLPVRLS